MKKEFIEPNIEVIEFEVKEHIADAYVDSEGWIVDPEQPWK